MLKLPVLEFLALDDLLIHEEHDPQRARPLAARIRASQLFRNPPVVAPLKDGTHRYMVLDGANRVTALRQMEYPHVIAQIVDPDDPDLSLQSWNHVVWELDPQRLIDSISHISSLHLETEKDPEALPDLWTDSRLAVIQDCRGQLLAVSAQVETLEERVGILSQIVASYVNKARLDRTNAHDIRLLMDIYPDLAGLILFPIFAINDLLTLVGKGCLLPAGITRFTIAPRALSLNYPLSELESSDPIEKKNKALQKTIQERLARKQVRYYSEPTVSFDE
jgi:L-serine kinase (ATP) / ParB family transcriptional regulator, heme-responsive regulator